MSHNPWLTKSEVNSLYYNAVGGEIGFATEGQATLHAAAAARLIARHARSLHKTEIRVLELGANNCVFARSVLQELRLLAAGGESALVRIDYLAVEYARSSLEAAASWEEAHGMADRVLWTRSSRPAAVVPLEPILVALVRRRGMLATNLGLVHAEASQFVRASGEHFDVALLNELLDDLPGRAFFADDRGRRYELSAHARRASGGWTVRVSASELADGTPPALAPRTLTGRSAAAVELVTGISHLLVERGMLLVHDYGFAVPYPSLATYQPLPRSLPAVARLEFPAGSRQSFPRSFFRVFADDTGGLIQITNDVNFAELGAALRATGTVVTLAHGNAIATSPGFAGFERGAGVFLSEFGLLEPGIELPSLLSDLSGRQERLRAGYLRDHAGGRESVFHDLVYLKA
jgi:hypothetical protein